MRRRWSRSTRLYMAASLALAIAAGILLHGYLARVSAATVALGPQVSVLVAAELIERGSVVGPADLRVARFPRVYAPPGFMDHISKAAGRVALSDLSPGEAVTETRLARVRAGPVASLIPKGLRAFAVPTSLPGGALVPGDRVDVLATYASGQPHTETVVAGVEVLFVLGPEGGGGGLDLDAAAAGAGTSTTLILLVSTEQQERLAFARAFADLQVAIAPAAELTG